MPVFHSLPAIPGWTIKPLGEARERIERRIDRDFNTASPDNRYDLSSRFRVGFKASGPNKQSVEVVYQYGHTACWTPKGNSSVERSDLYTAAWTGPALDGMLTLGRLQLDDEPSRMLLTSHWGITGRAWDGFKFLGKEFSLYGGRLAVNSTQNKEAIVFGASTNWRLGHTLLLYKHNEPALGSDDIYTLDHTYRTSLGPVTVSLEGALQLGQTDGQKLEAWALIGRGEWKPSKPWKVFAEIDMASGGRRGDTVLTFDQLYPSNHSLYGLMDLQGLRNVNAFSVGATYTVDKNLSLAAQMHKFQLRAADDAWYGDGGSAVKGFIDPTGSRGRDIGSEFELVATYALSSATKLEAGLGVFAPGGFVKSFIPANGRQTWFYLQAGWKF